MDPSSLWGVEVDRNTCEEQHLVSHHTPSETHPPGPRPALPRPVLFVHMFITTAVCWGSPCTFRLPGQQALLRKGGLPQLQWSTSHNGIWLVPGGLPLQTWAGQGGREAPPRGTEHSVEVEERTGS